MLGANSTQETAEELVFGRGYAPGLQVWGKRGGMLELCEKGGGVSSP